MCSKRRYGVLIIGPTSTKGGISSVIRTVLGAGVLQKDYDIWQINTSLYKDGNAFQEGLTFITAICKIFWFMATVPRIHIVHIHASSGISFFRKFIFFLISKAFRKRTIFHVHASKFEDFYGINSSKLINKLTKYVFNHCDAVVVLADIWKKTLSRNVSSHQKIHIVRNPILQCRFQDGAGRETEKPSRTRKVVLFMGFLIKNKGIYDLIEAVPKVIRAFPDARFVICGKGEEEKEIKKRVRDLNLHDYVELPGWVENNTKQSHLQMADIFVLPSYYEGMPMALLEAMSAGLPVVATRVGAIPEFVEDGKNGYLVEPGKPDILADRIVKLLKNEELLNKMKSENVRMAKLFDAKNIATKWSHLYNEIINSS